MTGDGNNGMGDAKGRSSRVWIVFLAILGGLLLVPGACGVAFTSMALMTPDDPYVGAVYMVSVPSVVIGALGGWLLRWAVRKYRSQADQDAAG